MKIWHMSGAGNDFMVMDARGGEYDFPALAVRLCSITGADGFMAVDHAAQADFRLHFYNSDGSRGELCGNGSRCICRFAYEMGIAGENMAFETDAGIAYGWRLEENRIRVQLPAPGEAKLDYAPGVDYVEVGCPHALRQYRGELWADKNLLKGEMEDLRHDPMFPKGTNVNYYTWLDDATVRILTFERGVENYTLACGTGTGALAVALWTRGLVPHGRLTVENPGGTLYVTLSGENGRVHTLLLEGPADVLGFYEIQL